VEMKLSQILKIAGVLIGVIAALTLVSLHPINILCLGIGAVIYLAGVWFKKKGK